MTSFPADHSGLTSQVTQQKIRQCERGYRKAAASIDPVWLRGSDFVSLPNMRFKGCLVQYAIDAILIGFGDGRAEEPTVEAERAVVDVVYSVVDYMAASR